MVVIEYKKFVGCDVTAGENKPVFSTAKLSVPSTSANSIKIMLDSMADIQGQECEPCCYWDIVKGSQTTLYVGIPSVIGQEIPIAKGIATVYITYNAVEALADNTIRNLKRIANTGSPTNTFCNVAVVWVIDEFGNAISNTEIWTVGTAIAIPFAYRTQNMRVRILPKSVAINFSVVDSGDRWVQRLG
jgi:hypothetical protein